MALTSIAINVQLLNTQTYTVPAGKTFIGSASFYGGNGGAGGFGFFTVNAVSIWFFAPSTSADVSPTIFKPLTLNAEDVIGAEITVPLGTTVGPWVAICGFLY